MIHLFWQLSCNSWAATSLPDKIYYYTAAVQGKIKKDDDELEEIVPLLGDIKRNVSIP